MRKSEYVLFENTPSSLFCEAYPIGNGHLGGMVYGNLPNMRLSLNRDDLWSGAEQDGFDTFDVQDYHAARDAALRGDYAEASKILSSRLGLYDSSAYMPLGDLVLGFPEGEISEYRRSLDLRDSVAEISFRLNGGHVLVRYFASNPNSVIAVEVESEFPLALSISQTAHFVTAWDFVDGMMVLRGECPRFAGKHAVSHHYPHDLKERLPVAFAGAVGVRADGEVNFDGTSYRVADSHSIRIAFSLDTSYYDGIARRKENFEQNAILTVRRALDTDAAALLARHITDVRTYFDRVSISLGERDRSDIPTAERIKSFMDEEGTLDTDLITLAFNFGRYLTIAASREGSLATNLQGIWNENLLPPWNSGYTVNINTEMNYWHTTSCDLMDLCQPLEQLAWLLDRQGKRSAAAIFGARGACAFHNADPFGFSTPAFGQTRWSFFPLSLCWIVRQFYENYEYTCDRDALARIYPLLRDCAEFILDMLVDDGQYWIIAPGTSPENAYMMQEKELEVSRSTTMFGALVRDILSTLLHADEALGLADPLAERARLVMPRLLPLRLLPDGRIEEFYFGKDEVDYTEAEVYHRHLSHLYDFYPARNVTPAMSALYEGARRSLDMRGDEATGWSLAWKMNCRARLGDGDAMMRLLRLFFTYVDPSITECTMEGGGVYPNLFCAHPPFQIDGNFGLCAAISEMLVGDRDGEPVLLPALPDKIACGSVQGLRIRGGRRVSFTFSNGHIQEYKITKA